jgi:phosphatidylserine/phosphatidylglycerophosphate/cardiolipin synthase-like enzyme
MHHKIIILDDQTVITGSFNFTVSADKYNDDNVIILRDHTLAMQYEQEFDRVMSIAKQPANTSC